MRYRFIVSFLFCICFTASLNAQSWVWAKDGGGSQACQGKDVCSDASGNVYTVGAFYVPSAAFGSVTLTSNGMRDAFITKYDPSGNLLWARGVGGTANDLGSAVTTDAAGNVYFSGVYTSPTITLGSFTLTNNNANCSSVFLVKYDPSGNVIWARSPGGPGCLLTTKLITDATGNVYLSGYFWNASITFGATTLPNSGTYDLFLVKYNPAGIVVWATGATCAGIDQGEGIAIDPSGNIYLSGSFSDTITFGTTTLISRGLTDAFLTKYTSQGNVIWARSAGGTFIDRGNQITTDASGSVYYTGSFNSDTMYAGAFNLLNSGLSSDMFICKYSSAGNVLWAQHGIGTAQDEGYDVAADLSGNIYVAGEFYSPSFSLDNVMITAPSGVFSPLFLAQLDVDGDVKCMSQLMSGGNRCRLDTDPLGNLLVCSAYYINPYPVFAVGADTFPDTGIERAIVAKRSSVIGVITSTATSCSINNGTANATIVNGSGFPYTYSWSPAGGNDSIATGLAAGTYTLTVTDPDGCISTQTAQITYQATPAISVSANASVHPGDSTQLFASGGASYSWSPPTGLSCTTCPDPFASPFQTTDYCVTVTDTNNCSATACLRVEVSDCPVYIPNAFSPNGDGQNDFECVRSRCLKTLHFFIYDRWGNKVFESYDPASCWDGTFRGKALETAVFTYTMDGVLSSGSEVRQSGNITLVR